MVFFNGDIIKLLRTADACDDGCNMCLADEGRLPGFQFFTEKFSNAVLNVIDDFFPAFLVGKMIPEAFYVFFLFFISRFLNGDYPALKVDIDYFVHGLSLYVKIDGCC